MKIEHIALWAADLEAVCAFYVNYLGASASEKYHNPQRNFTSRFLSFPDGGARIEVMNIPAQTAPASRENMLGLAHIAVSVGSQEAVDALTERLRSDGHTIAGEPRTTGDGYYESIVFDLEGNIVEITA